MSRILIVEDDRSSARLLGLLLKKGHHRSYVADSIEKAKRELFSHPEYELMILDNRLGDRFGWELLGELRDHFYFCDLPVIVYTAAGDRESVTKYVELKAQAIRAKPYEWRVLRAEIDKWTEPPWFQNDFVAAKTVMEQIQISPAEYVQGLRDSALQLKETADRLVENLITEKERPFTDLLHGLRGSAVNYGLNVVLRVITGAIAAFGEEDWPKAVQTIRTLNLVSLRLEARIQRLIAEDDEMLEAEARVGEIQLTERGYAVGDSPSMGVAETIFAEIPFGFGRLAKAWAQDDVIASLLLKCERGSLPTDDSAKLQSTLGEWIQWLSFLEPGEIQSVAAVLEDGEGIEPLLGLSSPARGEASAATLRAYIAERGVYPCGMMAAISRLMRELKRANFPLRLESLATRQLVSSLLVRAVASKIHRPVNLEAVVWLQFIGEWVFALRYPGVYALMLLETNGRLKKKYRDLFSGFGQNFAGKLNLPGYCLESLHWDDLQKFEGSGSSKLAVGLFALSEYIAKAHQAKEREQGVKPFALGFVRSSAWDLLADENLRLPTDRGKLFEALLRAVPGMVKESRGIFGQTHYLKS